MRKCLLRHLVIINNLRMISKVLTGVEIIYILRMISEVLTGGSKIRMEALAAEVLLETSMIGQVRSLDVCRSNLIICRWRSMNRVWGHGVFEFISTYSKFIHFSYVWGWNLFFYIMTWPEQGTILVNLSFLHTSNFYMVGAGGQTTARYMYTRSC